MLYWLFKYVIIGPFLRLTSRPVITGRENFPTSGAAILDNWKPAATRRMYRSQSNSALRRSS